MLTVYYDGTFEGFLNLLRLFIWERRSVENIKIKNTRICQEEKELFFEEIETQSELAKKFYCYLRRSLPKEFFIKIYTYYLCDTANIELILIRVLFETIKNPDFWQNFGADEVIKLHNVERMFYRERHRWLGFLRFIELPNKVLFAKFEPKFNVLPKIWYHFVKRFPNEKLIIFDARRKLLFLYREQKNKLIWVDDFELEVRWEIDYFVNLWKCYFNEISIPERYSYCRQRNKVPLYLRNFLPEFKV